MLAFLPDDAAARLLAAGAPAQHDRRDPHLPDRPHNSSSADIGASGLAAEQDEAVIGECALAGPVFDASGTTVGAIGLVMPSSNWPADPATRDATRDAARAISRELGATTWPTRA